MGFALSVKKTMKTFNIFITHPLFSKKKTQAILAPCKYNNAIFTRTPLLELETF